MAVEPESSLVPRPALGRVFSSTRRVRLADSSPGGRLRLDACARYLQDVANDDARDAETPNPTAWVARRTVINVVHSPRYLDIVTLSTWCSGLGPRWAERRYSVTGSGSDESRAAVEAATLWVHIDLTTMRPIGLPVGFADRFGQAAGGRTVSARLALATQPAIDAVTVAWPLRFVDFDVLGHVNNSVYWAMVEELLARRRDLRAPLTITLEHHDAIDRGDEVSVCAAEHDRGFDLWVTTSSGKTAAVVRAIADR